MVGNQDPGQEMGKARKGLITKREKETAVLWTQHRAVWRTAPGQDLCLYDKGNLSAAKSTSVNPSYSVNGSVGLPSPDACGTVPTRLLNWQVHAHFSSALRGTKIAGEYWLHIQIESMTAILMYRQGTKQAKKTEDSVISCAS